MRTNQDNTILFFKGFLRDSRYREEKFGLTEVKGKERDELAQEDHIHKLTKIRALSI